MRGVAVGQLRDTGELLGLYREAVRVGWCGDSEDGRLRFVATAEFALREGKKPCALFVSLLRKGGNLWVSRRDEDRAAERIREAMNPRQAPVVVPKAQAPKPSPTTDERFALAVVRVATAQRVDPYTLARSQRPSLTRERWDELAGGLVRGVA